MFSAPEDSRVIRWLKRAEKFSARFADHVIISNHLWHEKYSSRTGANGKCSVFINNVDTRVFYRRPRTRNDGKLIVLFPGGLQWHQGLDIAIRAFRGVVDRLPQAEFHIYGEGNMKPNLVPWRAHPVRGQSAVLRPLPSTNRHVRTTPTGSCQRGRIFGTRLRDQEHECQALGPGRRLEYAH